MFGATMKEYNVRCHYEAKHSATYSMLLESYAQGNLNPYNVI